MLFRKIIGLIKSGVERVENIPVTAGIILLVFGALGNYIYEKFQSSLDYVYVVEKVPNPVREMRERFNSSFGSTPSSYGISPDFERDAEEFAKIFEEGLIRFMQREEIDSDQMQIWVLNLKESPLNGVSFSFNECYGYVRHESDPIVREFDNSPLLGPAIMPRGLVYNHGVIQRGAFLKFGFKEIGGCGVIINAKAEGGRLAHGKLVTGNEYNELQDRMRYRKTEFQKHFIWFFCIQFVVFLFWIQILSRKINKRFSILESRINGNFQSLLDDGPD